MKLAYYQNPDYWKENATGVGSYGVLTVVNGEAFIDDIPLVQYIEQFSGRKCMFEFVFPDTVEGYEPDEGIQELVQKLKAQGIRTMGSCEGHIPGQSPYGKDSTVPYVCFYDKNIPSLKLPDGWHSEQGNSSNLWKIVADVNVVDELTLERAKELIRAAVDFYSK